MNRTQSQNAELMLIVRPNWHVFGKHVKTLVHLETHALQVKHVL